ncbi:MAG: hypothetical protein WCA31_13900 [Acidimicrobiales bacterium]
MYVELLEGALNEWVDGADNVDLVDHALTCRTNMLTASRRSANAYSALAAEVSYDRSLIKLAQAFDIPSDVSKFSNPGEERRRLERALVNVGVDLSALARHQRH